MSFKKVPFPELQKFRYSYSSAFLNNSKVAQDVVDRLNLDYYRPGVKVLDAWPANGFFAAALYNRLQPSQYVLMENRKEYHKYLLEQYLPSLPKDHRFDLQEKDAYSWVDYLDLTEKSEILQPGYQSRDKLHSDFLFAGTIHNEGLIMQFLSCIANQNWIQRFGSVKMLLWIPVESAVKIMGYPNTLQRAKCSLVRETFTDTKLIATSEDSASLKKFHKELLLKDDPLLFDTDAFSKGSKYSLLEINPKDHNMDSFTWDFVVKQLMASRNTPLKASLNLLGPAASDYFATKLPSDLMDRKPNSLSVEEFQLLVEVFLSWPFKPDSLIESFSTVKEI